MGPLQDDVLLHICSFLDSKDLIAFESICRRTRRVAAHLQGCSAWRQAIVSRIASHADGALTLCMRDVVTKIVEDVVCTGVYRREQIEKRLVSLLEPTRKTRLLLNSLVASSYDSPEENLSKALNPIIKTTRMISYWSSSGSESSQSSESVSFTVYPPCAVITRISLRPFAAWFQRGRPVYPAKTVRFSMGGIPLYANPNTLVSPRHAIGMVCEDYRMQHDDPACSISLSTLMGRLRGFGPNILYESNESTKSIYHGEEKRTNPLDLHHEPGWDPDTMRFQTQQFPMEPVDELQHFDLPTPALCINGYLKIDLMGKVTRQQADMKYYTCLGYVTCEGYNLQGFFYNRETGAFEYLEDHIRNAEVEGSSFNEQIPSDSESEVFQLISDEIMNSSNPATEREQLRAAFNM